MKNVNHLVSLDSPLPAKNDSCQMQIHAFRTQQCIKLNPLGVFEILFMLFYFVNSIYQLRK